MTVVVVVVVGPEKPPTRVKWSASGTSEKIWGDMQCGGWSVDFFPSSNGEHQRTSRGFL